MADQPSPRRRFQFRLLTPMIGVATLAAFCWIVHEWIARPREFERADKAAPKAAVDANRADEIRALPRYGYVSDSDTAIKIAVAVWEPIYGKEEIAGEKPYRARLANDVWTVEGSLPDGWDGGVAIVEIAKRDGEILSVTHGR